MDQIDFDDPTMRPATAAALLIDRHGHGAIETARAEAERACDDPARYYRWRGIADAARLMARANIHMDLALQLLDEAGEMVASPHLDLAIVRLGLRPKPPQRSIHQPNRSPPQQRTP